MQDTGHSQNILTDVALGFLMKKISNNKGMIHHVIFGLIEDLCIVMQ